MNSPKDYGKHKTNWGFINVVNSDNNVSYQLDKYGKLKIKFPRNPSRNISRDYKQYFNQNACTTSQNDTSEINSASSVTTNQDSATNIFNINAFDNDDRNENDYQFDDVFQPTDLFTNFSDFDLEIDF